MAPKGKGGPGLKKNNPPITTTTKVPNTPLKTVNSTWEEKKPRPLGKTTRPPLIEGKKTTELNFLKARPKVRGEGAKGRRERHFTRPGKKKRGATTVLMPAQPTFKMKHGGGICHADHNKKKKKNCHLSKKGKKKKGTVSPRRSGKGRLSLSHGGQIATRSRL